MRLLGHPVHVMLVHFPVALWPAHWLLHVFAARLPEGVAGVAGFWLLVGATVLGWAAAVFGVFDLIGVRDMGDAHGFKLGLWHAVVNGVVLMAFTTLCFYEYGRYPDIAYSFGWLVAEAIVLLVMTVGNYFGGAVVWGGKRPATTTGYPP